MSVQVKHRRDTALNIAGFTPAQGELIVDTTNNRLIVGDGATAGGFPVAMARRTAVADAAYTALNTDRIVAYTSLTAARTVTLPAASAFPAGETLRIVDESGACSPAKPIKVAAAGTDTINGAGSISLLSAYGSVSLESNGASGWAIVGGGAGATLLAAASANGATFTLNVLEQIVSGMSGASVTASTPIPANAIALAISSRTVTAITGATSYEVGWGTGTTLTYGGSGLGVAAGSTNTGVLNPTAFYSSTPVIITATGGSFTAGAVRLSISYLTFTPPTS